MVEERESVGGDRERGCERWNGKLGSKAVVDFVSETEAAFRINRRRRRRRRRRRIWILFIHFLIDICGWFIMNVGADEQRKVAAVGFDGC